MDSNIDSRKAVTNFIEGNFNILNLKDKLRSYPENILALVQRKLDELDEPEEFKYKTIILKMIKIYEYLSTDDADEAFSLIEPLIEQINCFENQNCSDFLFRRISVAIRYQILSYKLYASLIKKNEKDVQKLLNELKGISEMDNSNRAGMYGIKATMILEYGILGSRCALTLIEKAKELDPDNAYWHFLIGKILGRIRRAEKWYEIPSDEEITACKKAIELEEHYLFMLFAAETFAETASHLYKFHTRNRTFSDQTQKAIDQMNQESVVLFRKCYERHPDLVQILFRTAKGFLKFPRPFKDSNFAEMLIKKGLERAPLNPLGNHLMAQVLERYHKNLSGAKKYLEICIEAKVFGAHMDLFRIIYQQNGSFDVKAMENLLRIYHEDIRKAQILSQLAFYYLFVADDLEIACKYLRECMKLEYAEQLKNFHAIFIISKEKIPLIDVLVDEINNTLEKKCSSEKTLFYQEFLFDLVASNIELSKGLSKNLKDDILKTNEYLKQRYEESKLFKTKPTALEKAKTAGSNRPKNRIYKNVNLRTSKTCDKKYLKNETITSYGLKNNFSETYDDTTNRQKKVNDLFDFWIQDIKQKESEGEKSAEIGNS